MPFSPYPNQSISKAITRTFVRTVEKTQFTSSLGGATNYALIFKLSDLPNYTEFTALFDQYKFDRVEVDFIPVVTTTNSALTVDSMIWTAVDFDDANATTALQIAEYENCHVYPPTQRFSVDITPRVALAAYAGAFTSYANVGSIWLDVGSPSIEHYGFKVGCNTAGGATQTWKIVCRYMLSFKSAR